MTKEECKHLYEHVKAIGLSKEGKGYSVAFKSQYNTMLSMWFGKNERTGDIEAQPTTLSLIIPGHACAGVTWKIGEGSQYKKAMASFIENELHGTFE